MVGCQSSVQGVVEQRLRNHGEAKVEAHTVVVVVADNLGVVDSVVITPHTAQNEYLAVIGCAATPPC